MERQAEVMKRARLSSRTLLYFFFLRKKIPSPTPPGFFISKKLLDPQIHVLLSLQYLNEK